MSYRFYDQKPGDMLELSSGQLIVKTDRTQALCLQGDRAGLLLDVPHDASVDRIADREDMVQAILDDC